VPVAASARALWLGLFVWLGLGLHAAVAYVYLAPAPTPLGREGLWLGLLAYTAGSAALLHRVFSGLREWGRAQHVGEGIDPQSGLCSEDAYRARLQQLWREGARSGQSWCLLLIGLDDVQGLDAQLGRFHVDRAIRVVASALQGSLHQPQHRCYRLGEREFALLLPHCRLEQASELARHLQQALAHSRLRVGRHRSVRLSVSVGLSEVHLGRDWHRVQVERRARQALTAARQAGRQQLRSRR
jgi:diguanylate cyclase (GGDEF)-like protein